MWDNAKRRVWPASKNLKKVDFDRKKKSILMHKVMSLMQNLNLIPKMDFDAKS